MIQPSPGRQRGAILVTFAVSALMLLAFAGLALDVGLIYMSRAALSKGVDAAALMGARTLSQGHDNAKNIARSTFAMNYATSGLSGRAATPPAVNVDIGLNEDGHYAVTVTASVTMSTYFLPVLKIVGGDWTRMTVSSTAEASRAQLVMGIALDRSGSMEDNGGDDALPPAVKAFIDFFDDAIDQVALTSYAYHSTVDFEIGHNFKAPIRYEVDHLNFNGWTYSHGGIDMARAEINAAPLDPDENVLKVLVFFTDGHANSFLVPRPPGVRCTGNSTRALVLVPPLDDRGRGATNSTFRDSDFNDDFRDPDTGASVSCSRTESDYFVSARTGGTTLNRTYSNVVDEGLFMAERSAQLARQDGTLVFAIGLGNDINQSSLRKMANDPSSPSFDPNQPAGIAAFAPTADELDDVFRQIASKILLRLTQ